MEDEYLRIAEVTVSSQSGRPRRGCVPTAAASQHAGAPCIKGGGLGSKVVICRLNFGIWGLRSGIVVCGVGVSRRPLRLLRLCFFFALDKGPGKSLSPKLSDTIID